MVKLYALLVLGLSFAAGRKFPPGIHGPWKDLEGTSFPDIPYPFKPAYEEYVPNIDWDGCGGTITEPYVISTAGFPFSSRKQTCTWKIETRKCFVPNLTVLNANGLSETETVMEIKLGSEPPFSFMKAKPMTSYRSPNSTAEVRYSNNLEDPKDYGFQVLVDFLPTMTKECLDGFVDLPDMTCTESEKNGDKFTVKTPKHPKLTPAGFACKYLGGIDKQLNYKVRLTGEIKQGDQLIIRDLIDDKVFTVGKFNHSMSVASPYNIVYTSATSSVGFRAEFVPEDAQPPAPCNTDVIVSSTRVTITNPFTSPTFPRCVIKFKPADPAKPLSFTFNDFATSSSDYVRIVTRIYGLPDWRNVWKGYAQYDTWGHTVLYYKPGASPGPWKLHVQQF